jgi:hypothetical protein
LETLSEVVNSTVEGGDLHTFRIEPTSGREITNRTQNTTEDRIRNLSIVTWICFCCNDSLNRYAEMLTLHFTNGFICGTWNVRSIHVHRVG